MFYFSTLAVAVGVILVLAILRRRRRKVAGSVQVSIRTRIQWLVYSVKRRRRIQALMGEEKNNPIFRPSSRMSVASIRSECFGSGKSKVWLPAGAKAKNIQDLRDKLKLRSDDVVIAAYPKSGTTWTQNIVKLIRNRGVEDGKELEEVSPWVDMMTLEEVEVGCICGFVAISEGLLILYADKPMQAMKSPRSFKTHMPFQHKLGGDLENSPAKYIYTYRNPKDTAVSFFHFFCKGYFPLMDWDVFVERFLDGSLMCGTVLEHVMGWWEQRGKNKCDSNSKPGPAC